MLHARKQTPAEEELATTARRGAIQRARRAANLLEYRRFVARGLVRAWEFAHEQRMGEPPFDLEPSLFIAWLGLDYDFSVMGGETALETKVSGRLEKEEAFSHRRALVNLLGRRHKRYALLLLACPRWADRRAIRAIYAACRVMNEAAGYVAYHVDHEIPLAGRAVTGLHVETNLRIITAIDNLRKSNKYA